MSLPLAAASRDDTRRAGSAKVTLVTGTGRLATLDEIADAVVFLSSPAARYSNGQVLYVDGGFLADFGVPPAQGAIRS